MIEMEPKVCIISGDAYQEYKKNWVSMNRFNDGYAIVNHEDFHRALRECADGIVKRDAVYHVVFEAPATVRTKVKAIYRNSTFGITIKDLGY